MTNLPKIKEILQQKQASLVVEYEDGIIKEYYQNGIKDIINILRNNENCLKDAIVADKVIGKVAASILIVAGVKEIFADTISQLAIPILEESGISYQYYNKVEYIQNRDKTGMCPMEAKWKEENIQNIYQKFIKHPVINEE